MNVKIEQPACPIARAIACAGDSWSLLILRDANQGTSRYDDFRKRLGVSPNILAQRLARLTDEGFLMKRRYSDRPARDEYLLTTAGRDFLPVLMALGHWGRTHRPGDRLTRFLDKETGQDIEVKTIDGQTGAIIGTRPIEVVEP